MATTLFVSYSRADMQETNWLDRLKMYLSPFRRNGTIDAWDDRRIAPGTQWRTEIAHALVNARAAVLIVGPGFLASDFVMEEELPALLESAKNRSVALFPLVVGFCAYNETDLHPYQAFNTPDKPLESLPRSEQNRILNDLAIAIDKSCRSDLSLPTRAVPEAPNLNRSLQDMQMHLSDTWKAFIAQCRRRDDLVAEIEHRLKFKNDLEYEKFFLRYHSRLTEAERFEFDQIRAITEGPLQTANRKILQIIETHPRLLDEIPMLTALRQHLIFWLNKYDKVFVLNRAMCLLYTGVEDAVPFPEGLEAIIASHLRAGGDPVR